jgi:hypothetical protein
MLWTGMGIVGHPSTVEIVRHPSTVIPIQVGVQQDDKWEIGIRFSTNDIAVLWLRLLHPPSHTQNSSYIHIRY